jgi:hypothetical protein
MGPVGDLPHFVLEVLDEQAHGGVGDPEPPRQFEFRGLSITVGTITCLRIATHCADSSHHPMRCAAIVATESRRRRRRSC